MYAQSIFPRDALASRINRRKFIERAMSIKSWLRKILPASSSSLEGYGSRAITEVLKVDMTVKNVGNEVDNVKATLNEIQKDVRRGEVWYPLLGEREFVRSTWASCFDESQVDRYARLIANLDDESVETVCLILGRVRKMLEEDDIDSDMFSEEELKQIRMLRDHFYPLIVKLADDVYAYRNYYLPTDHFEPSVFYYKHGIDLLRNRESVKGRDILDIGGFVGDSVLVLEELEPRRIHTFEAEPHNYALMQRTMELNKIDNVVLENLAVGDKKGELHLNVMESATTCLNVSSHTYTDSISVPMITIDDYVRENDVDVALIKVDIEGAEPLFLEGAKETIAKFRPIILLSIYHNSHDFFELKPLIESWNLDYVFRVYRPPIETPTTEVLLIVEPKEHVRG